jgi:hypothetical protein
MMYDESVIVGSTVIAVTITFEDELSEFFRDGHEASLYLQVGLDGFD